MISDGNSSDTVHLVFPERVFYIVYSLLCGGLSVAGNAFLVAVIWRNKPLQVPCFVMILVDALNGMVLAAGTMVNGLEELLELLDVLSERLTRAGCYWLKCAAFLFSVGACSQLATFIGGDRLMSILFPLAYRQHSKTYLQICTALCTAEHLTLMFVAFVYGDPLTNSVLCRNMFDALHPQVASYMIGINSVFSVLVVLVYALMFVSFEWKRRRLRGDDSAVFLRQQRVVLPTVRLLVLFYVIFGITPEVIVGIMDSRPEMRYYTPRLFQIAVLSKTTVTFANVVALGFGSRQFRKCAKDMLGFKKHGSEAGVQIRTIPGT